MDVKDAVKTAKDWLLDVADKQPANLGLEEVEFDDFKGVWNITLGFARPWNWHRNALSPLTGELIEKRNDRPLWSKRVTEACKAWCGSWTLTTDA
jgi:hypothetical protein